MKAIEINGKIKVYDPLPESWKGVMGNFSKLSDEEIKAYGFYDVVVPKYDQRVEVLGDLYFDSANKIFTQDINDKTWVLTLAELKEQVINNFNHEIYIKLMETDWQIVRKYETNVAVPENILTKRKELREQADKVKTDINALTTKKAVMSFDLPNII